MMIIAEPPAYAVSPVYPKVTPWCRRTYVVSGWYGHDIGWRDLFWFGAKTPGDARRKAASAMRRAWPVEIAP